ncbi:MAG TPA: GGDEF domain-containing protein [Myxococcota bacterium]|nr:GGDEF domain-containing protein [Myxococcota bacterium]HRY96044.1 GGDEF domain-containing protein [Myxococcota bacterium]HSA21858.1 GGDEF domain-containing protein [Myxococcota bacterium]
MRASLPFLLVLLPTAVHLAVYGALPAEPLGWVYLGAMSALALLAAGWLSWQTRRIASLGERDELTGLFNRRRFEADLRREVLRSERQHYRLSLAFLDIDHFKGIVERHGQAEADSVLRRMAAVLGRSVRDGVDSAYRLGGDRFAAIMPDVDEQGATVVLDRIWGKTGSDELPLPRYGAGLSMGLVARQPGEASATFLKRAEELLVGTQRAKRRASVAPPASQAPAPIDSQPKPPPSSGED